MAVVPCIRMALRDLQNNTSSYWTGGPVDDDLFHWQIRMKGHEESPYADGVFILNIYFPVSFPHAPPKINFVTKIFHPNVNESGGIYLKCLLLENWRPTLFISGVLYQIYFMMETPNLGREDMFVQEISNLYKNDRDSFVEIARKWTKIHATAEF